MLDLKENNCIVYYGLWLAKHIFQHTFDCEISIYIATRVER